MIYIYTDGACSGNPGPGGSAFIAVKNEEKIYEWKMPIPDFTYLSIILIPRIYII